MPGRDLHPGVDPQLQQDEDAQLAGADAEPVRCLQAGHAQRRAVKHRHQVDGHRDRPAPHRDGAAAPHGCHGGPSIGCPQQTTRPSSTIRRGSYRVARSSRGSLSKTTRSAGAASVRPAKSQPLPAPPGRLGDDLGLRDAGLHQSGDLLADEPVRQRAAGVGPGVDRHAGFEGVADPLPGIAVQRPHVRGVGRELLLRRPGDLGKGVDVDQRRHHRDPPAGDLVQQVGGDPGAVLDRVDAGVDQPRQRLLAEGVRGDPHAELVGASDRRRQHVVRPGRRQVPDRAVDPVGGQLDPAVAPGCLVLHLGHQVLRLHLDAEVADVAAGTGDVAPGPHQPRQVGAALHAGVVHRRRRRRAAAGRRRRGRAAPARPGRPAIDPAVGGDADMAVRVDETGHDPAAGGDGLARRTPARSSACRRRSRRRAAPPPAGRPRAGAARSPAPPAWRCRTATG